MKTIIAPVDFSAASRNASLYACNLASQIGAQVILLHVAVLPASVAALPVSEDYWDSLSMDKELADLKHELLEKTGNKVVIQSKIVWGSTVESIKDVCTSMNPIAVVMGAEGAGPGNRLFIGATTLRSARHLKFPVFIVPETAVFSAVKKVALACDFEDIYDTPAGEIKNFVRLFNASFEIFYVNTNDIYKNRKVLEQIGLYHHFRSLSPSFHFIDSFDVLTGISQLSKENNIDLLILISKKHGLFHKSQTKEFVYHLSMPILVLHENEFSD